MKCAIYARVSTAEGKQSYERQVNELKALAIKDGFKPKDIEVYAEMQSGFDKDRNQLNVMLTNIRNSPTLYSMVYVSELTRLGRNVNHTREIIDELTSYKIPIWLNNLKQSTLDKNGKTPFGTSVVTAVLLEIGKYEVETMKERSSSGRMQRAKNGYWAMGSWNIPYGYKKGEDGRIEFDKEEKKVVEQIFKWYLKDGKGFGMIATLLNGKGVQTRSNKAVGDKDMKYKMYTKKGSQVKWVDATIKSMVENPIYYGVRKFKGEEIELPHLAIITKEEYEEVQRIRLSRTNKNHLTIYPYLLKNKLGCGVCGRGFSSRYARNSKKDKVFRCASGLTNGNYCNNHSVNIDMIESILLDILVRRNSFPLSTVNLASTEIEKYKEEIAELKLLNIELNKEINKEEGKKARLVDLYTEGLIKKSELTNQKNEIENNTKNLKKRLQINLKSIASKEVTIKDLDNASLNKKLNKDTSREELAKLFTLYYPKVLIKKFDKKYVMALKPIKGGYSLYFIDKGAAHNTRGEKKYRYKIVFLTGKNDVVLNGNQFEVSEKVIKMLEKMEWEEVKKENMLVM